MLVVFDCDGTLVDSQANIVRAMADTFRAEGLPPPDSLAVRRVVGLNLEEAMAALLPEESRERHRHFAHAYKLAFRRLRAETLLHAEPLFDGIAPLLQTLSDAGHLLAVATGKSDRGLRHLLEEHGLTHHFISLQTADRHPSKPHPAMLHAALAESGSEAANAVMVGDTTYDMAMAQAAGVRAIGVAWGYHAPDELRKSGAIGVAETARELEDFIHAQPG